MSPPVIGGSSRATRATILSAANLKTKEEQAQAIQAMLAVIKDVALATDYLLNGDLKNEDEELTLETLGGIALQLSQQSRFTRQASDAFKALAYLILDLQRKQTVNSITDVIAKAVNVATKRVQKELDEVSDLILSMAVTSNNAAEELREG